MTKNRKLKTAFIIGRWQPWHEGHKELFKAALERAERVAIGVRSTHATDEKILLILKKFVNLLMMT